MAPAVAPNRATAPMNARTFIGQPPQLRTKRCSAHLPCLPAADLEARPTATVDARDKRQANTLDRPRSTVATGGQVVTPRRDSCRHAARLPRLRRRAAP